MAGPDVAAQIAEVLGETDPVPVGQIAAIVATIGDVEALGLLAQTERVESSGGMLVPDGSRKRTRGGIFFVLARKRLTGSQRSKIFGHPVGPQPGARDVAATPEPTTGGTIEHGAALTVLDPKAGAAPDPTQRLVRLPRRTSGAATNVPAPAGRAEISTPPTVATPPPRPAKPEPRAERASTVEGALAQIDQIAAQLDATARAALEKRLGERYGARERSAAPLAYEAMEIALRKWMLAAVGAQLGTPLGEIARAVTGDDTPGARQAITRLQASTLHDVLLAANAHEKPNGADHER